jgi:hypothetical protein
LEELIRGPMTPESDQKKFELGGLIEKLLEHEEIKWSQRSRANWIKSGDKSTSFFHSYVMTHKYRGSQQSSREVKPKFIDST